jgi:hypothetical protein
MQSAKTVLVMAACLFLAGPATLIGVAQAQAEPLSCEEIQSIANGSQPLVDALNEAGYAGYEKKYNKRMTFRIDQLAGIAPDECGALMELEVAFRKLRAHFRGTMRVWATLSADRYDGAVQICVLDAEVIDLKLAGAWTLGQRFYDWIAHTILPDLEKCVAIPRYSTSATAE